MHSVHSKKIKKRKNEENICDIIPCMSVQKGVVNTSLKIEIGVVGLPPLSPNHDLYPLCKTMCTPLIAYACKA